MGRWAWPDSNPPFPLRSQNPLFCPQNEPQAEQSGRGLCDPTPSSSPTPLTLTTPPSFHPKILIFHPQIPGFFPQNGAWGGRGPRDPTPSQATPPSAPDHAPNPHLIPFAPKIHHFLDPNSQFFPPKSSPRCNKVGVAPTPPLHKPRPL